MLKFCYALIFTLLTMTHSYALTSEPVKSDTSTARLVTNADSISAGQYFTVALHLDLAKDWHSYWKNPGDSGIATTLEFDLPEGFETSDIIWQTPSRYELAGIVNYGYANEVYHFVNITAPNILSQDEVTLNVSASWLVCKDICIPEYADFALTLPVSNVPSPSSAIFKDALDNVPANSELRGNFAIDKQHVVIALPKKGQLFPEQENIIANDTLPDIVQEGGMTYYRFKKGFESIDTMRVVIKSDDGKATSHLLSRVDTISFPDIPASNTQTQKKTSSLWLIVSLALLGGIILNLMPCVLPILSLKALTLVELSNHSRKQAALHGIAYLGGILLTFAAITVLISLLQQAGMRVGWGFQLQSPVFVGALALLLAAVGMNLSGMFNLPVLLGGMAQGKASRSTPTGSFFTGIMAVIIATPCTAPFMAPAIGYALSQSFKVQLLIFCALGVGLALPYLLLAFIPALQRFLPKPGAWMNTFKHALAFPMYATAAWLLWVITRQSGTDALAIMLCALLALSFLLWCYGRTMMPYKKYLFIGAMTLTVIVTLKTLKLLSTPSELSLKTISYSETLLNKALVDEQRIFVYGTADWCITCKINERVALNNDAVISHFQDNNIIVLKADWTSYDDNITEYLKRYDRAGVPIYVYYNKKGQDTLLPQILTPQLVIDTTQ